MKFPLRTLAAAALLAGGVALAASQDSGGALASAAGKAAPSDAEVIAQQKPSYPLTTCPISGEKLGGMGAPVDKVVDGHLVRLCCGHCTEALMKDPKAAIAKIDEAVIRVQKPMWPAALTACPVSGETYEEPVDFVYGTRYVKLCCNNCKRGFAKSPDKFLAQIDRALIADQKKTYPLDTCPISGEKLDEDAKDVLYGVTLVRFCCGKCAASFEKNPEPVLEKVEAARKEKAKAQGGEKEKAAGGAGSAGGR